MASIYFILGGSNSGKTKFSEKLSLEICSLSGKLYFVATGVAFDKEMQVKIDLHKKNRNSSFSSIESANTVKGISPEVLPAEIVKVPLAAV